MSENHKYVLVICAEYLYEHEQTTDRSPVAVALHHRRRHRARTTTNEPTPLQLQQSRDDAIASSSLRRRLLQLDHLPTSRQLRNCVIPQVRNAAAAIWGPSA